VREIRLCGVGPVVYILRKQPVTLLEALTETEIAREAFADFRQFAEKLQNLMVLLRN
jgi:hypothetical protein